MRSRVHVFQANIPYIPANKPSHSYVTKCTWVTCKDTATIIDTILRIGDITCYSISDFESR